jgi:hypothetical protein
MIELEFNLTCISSSSSLVVISFLRLFEAWDDEAWDDKAWDDEAWDDGVLTRTTVAGGKRGVELPDLDGGFFLLVDVRGVDMSGSSTSSSNSISLSPV